MGQINDWLGTIGGAILALELIVLLLILVGINAALALGLRWALRKSTFVHEKITWARALAVRYVDKGANLVAAPVIITTSAWRGLKAGLYRATHWPGPRAAGQPGTTAAGAASLPDTSVQGKPTRAA
ncbi:MAG TPA: hypothetical protein VHB98_11440 [Chloroflexota bacterium]|jgi:uncharacterized membrane protein YedE/YeeE|nr:hypothetical protein [Chloroflexota bacterium]